MTITAIAKQVVQERSAVQVRFRSGGKGEAKQYDCKPLFTGRKRGWVLVDMQTANAILTVYEGLREDLRARVDTVPMGQLVEFCWKAVA